MKKIVSTFTLVLVSISLNAHATSATECKIKINEARASLVDMLGSDKPESLKQKVEETADNANNCINQLTGPKEKEADLSELKKVWGDFKNTREKELVPAILAGKKDIAKTIGTGVQAERMNKMQKLIRSLEGSDL